QSEHLAVYRGAIEQLARRELVYRSFESRADIAALVSERETAAPWPRDPDGAPLFPGAPLAQQDEARLIEAGAPYAWRLDMAKAVKQTGPLTWIELGNAPEIEQGPVI